MMRFAVGRPSPDPRDFVVKNGVKIFSRGQHAYLRRLIGMPAQVDPEGTFVCFGTRLMAPI